MTVSMQAVVVKANAVPQRSPPALMIRPPSAGPMKREILKIMELAASAEASRSRPTRANTSVMRDGRLKAMTDPRKIVIPSSSQMFSTPVKLATAIITE